MPGFELFGDEEKKEVLEVLDTGVLMRYGFDPARKGQYKAKQLESELKQTFQTEYAQLVSSGTAALTVALAAAGVGSGDEVILPTFTFVASFEAVLAIGAVPILCDIDATLALDPQAVESLISEKTKVVMPVHMCGSMAKLDALQKICKRNHLILLEDACQAIGGYYQGKPLGSFGDLGCFSFDYVKTITCGEGGAILTDTKEFADRMHKFHDHGHDHRGTDRGKERHPFLGYNFRISELQAAVGVAQIRKLNTMIRIQQQNYRSLKEVLSTIPDLRFRSVPDFGTENYGFLTFFMPTTRLAAQVHQALVAHTIDGCFYWFANNWHYYKQWDHLFEQKTLSRFSAEVQQGLRKNKKHFPESDVWMGKAISCLIKLSWTEKEMQERADKIKQVITKTMQQQPNIAEFKTIG